MTDEKIIDEVLKDIYKDYPNFLSHDEFCFDNKAPFGEPCTECSKELRKYLEKALQKKQEEIEELKKGCAWCPLCGDLLKIKQNKLKPYENWIYVCEGCEKEFSNHSHPCQGDGSETDDKTNSEKDCLTSSGSDAPADICESQTDERGLN